MALARSGSLLFYRPPRPSRHPTLPATPPPGDRWRTCWPCAGLLALVLALTALGRAALRLRHGHRRATAAPQGYVQAVLGRTSA